MAPTVGDVRRWAPGGLTSVADVLVSRCATLVGLQDELDATVQPDGWVGHAADAAHARRGVISESLRRLVAQVQAVRTGADDAAASVTAVQAALLEAETLAVTSYFQIGDDGAVRDAAPGGLVLDEAAAADRGRMFAELQGRVAQVLRTAGEVDADLAGVLRAAAADTIDDGTGTTLIGAAFTGMTQGADTTDLPPPEGGSPAENNAYWHTLTDAQRQDILDHHPELVGNLDGIPATIRDVANRHQLPAAVTAARAELDRAQTAWDDRGTGTKIGQLLIGEKATGLDEDLQQAKDKLRALNLLNGYGADRQILLLDTSGEMVKAAVANGDVDTADHVAVFTPGFTSTVEGSMEGYDKQMNQLEDQTRGQLLLQGRADETVATVTWMGYEAPQWGSFDDDLDLTDTVATSDTAKEGGHALAGFLNGVDASHDVDPHLTTLGHSYGSTTTGYALQDGTGADDAVFFGSPGLGTSDVGDLGVPAGHVFVAEADWDPVADLAAFGPDPNQMPGVTGISTHDGTGPDGVDRGGSSGHSEYLNDQTMAQYNMSVIIAGSPELTVQGSADGFGDGFRRGLGAGF